MARISLAVCLLLLLAFSAVYEVQGTGFLLRHYLRKLPRRSRDSGPFACKGMMIITNILERRCPLKPAYKGFFGNLRSYINFVNSASGSQNFDVELKGQAQGLLSAMSALGGNGGSSADNSNVLSALMSMGKTLNQQKSSGSTFLSFSQRKELIVSMAQWARVIGQFVSSAASQSGTSIDVSSLGIDGIDANVVAAPAGATGTPTGATDFTTTGTATTGTSQTTNGGTSTSGCTTSQCSTGGGTATGGSSFKGSLNYQSGQQSSAGGTA